MCLKFAHLRSNGGVQGDLFTDLVELWKRMDLPEDSSDHVSQEQYDTQIQEMLISPLRQHHIGCVMAFLSAHELFANSIRSEMGNVVKLSAAPQSRLSFHLQARLLSHLQALLSPWPREPLRSVSQRLARPLVGECSTKRHICAWYMYTYRQCCAGHTVLSRDDPLHYFPACKVSLVSANGTTQLAHYALCHAPRLGLTVHYY